jgi:uncharacterized membrane protein YvbJ
MAISYDSCPHCGQTVIKGAMRCLGCGKILKTAEEQAASIERLKKSKKKMQFMSIVKFVLFIIVIIVLYYVFSEEITDLFNHYF